jgi:hypothetical protein
MAIDKKIIEVLNAFNVKLNDDTRLSLKTKLRERAVKTLAKSKFKDKSIKDVQSRLEASIKPIPAVYEGGGITIKLVMNDYWEVVDKGRKAANVSSEGQSKIQDWSSTRGVAEKIRISDLEKRKEKQSKSERKGKLKTLKKMPFDRAKKAAAFLIARKLKSNKLEPTYFFSEIKNDGRIQKLEQDLAEIMETEIIVDIQSGWQ